jgi:hypothetical protein
MIPKEHLQQWLSDPITKKVFSQLSSVREDHKSLLCEGHSLNLSSCETTALQTARILGIISGLNLLLEMEVQED